MSLPTVRKVMYGICLIGFILLISSVAVPDEYNLKPVFQLIGYLILICGGIFSLIFYRCPGCHGLLHSKGFFTPKYCSHCGDELE